MYGIPDFWVKKLVSPKLIKYFNNCKLTELNKIFIITFVYIKKKLPRDFKVYEKFTSNEILSLVLTLLLFYCFCGKYWHSNGF